MNAGMCIWGGCVLIQQGTLYRGAATVIQGALSAVKLVGQALDYDENDQLINQRSLDSVNCPTLEQLGLNQTDPWMIALHASRYGTHHLNKRQYDDNLSSLGVQKIKWIDNKTVSIMTQPEKIKSSNIAKRQFYGYDTVWTKLLIREVAEGNWGTDEQQMADAMQEQVIAQGMQAACGRVSAFDGIGTAYFRLELGNSASEETDLGGCDNDGLY